MSKTAYNPLTSCKAGGGEPKPDGTCWSCGGDGVGCAPPFNPIPAIRLYAAMRDMPLASAAVAVASFLDPVNNTAARLAACHREMVAEAVAPLVEALREIALTENCMEGENLTAELIENAHDEMITKARKTLEQWEKNNAT